jgi:hypothetical protein
VDAGVLAMEGPLPREDYYHYIIDALCIVMQLEMRSRDDSKRTMVR